MSSVKSNIVLNSGAMFQHGIVLLALGPLVPEMIESFQIDESAVGVLLSVGSLGFMIGPILAGMLIDRRGIRSAFVVGIVLEIAFLVVFGLSPSFWLATAANFFVRFGSSFIETGANVMPSLIATRRSAHALMNFIHLFFSVGAFVGPLGIGLFLSSSTSWRPVFFFLIVPTVLLFVGVERVRIASDVRKASLPRKSTGGILVVLKRRSTWFGSLSLFLYVGAEIGISAWIVLYLQRIHDFSVFVSSAGLSVLWISIMLGRCLNSVLGNRYSAATLVTFSGIGGAVGGILLLYTSSMILVFVLLGWIGLCLAGVFPNIMAEINRRDPERIGAVTAIMTTGAAAGAAIVQWIMGIFAENFGLRVAFVIPAGLQLLEVVAFHAAIYERRPGKNANFLQ